MFNPAHSNRTIFIRKGTFSKYTIGFVMNINTPVRTAPENANQVHLMMSDSSAPNVRLIEATPSRRKSTISMVPNTSVSSVDKHAICSDSRSGAQSIGVTPPRGSDRPLWPRTGWCPPA